MASLDDPEAIGPIKLLFIGDSGTGKTGALASLAEAGYNLRILDYDVGLAPLRKYTKKEFLKNITYETLTDKMKKGVTGIVTDGAATAYTRGLALLDNWPPFGPVKTWTQKDILVIDSLSKMSSAAMRYVMKINGRTDLVARRGEADPRQLYGEAQFHIEQLCTMLYDNAVPCHVIICAHITFIGGDEEEVHNPVRGYPQAIGKALPPKIPQYFNTMLQAKIEGSNRIISTKPDGLIPIKAPLPDLPKHLPLSTGLATFFKEYYK